MPYTIEIEGNLVSLIERTVRNSIPLTDWLPQIERRSPVNAPVLPTNTRAVWWDPTDITNQRLLVMVEYPPQIINLNMNGSMFRLSIPWTRFIFFATTDNPADSDRWRLEDYRLFWSNTRYRNVTNTDMIAALIPNVYSDGRICFGSTGAPANQSLADRIDQTVNEFYLSEFNNDLSVRLPTQESSFASWERHSTADPLHWAAWSNWTDTSNNFSWNMILDIFSNAPSPRQEALVTPDEIPPLALGASFGRVSDWLMSLNNNQRARLQTAIAIQVGTTPDLFIPTPTLAEPA